LLRPAQEEKQATPNKFLFLSRYHLCRSSKATVVSNGDGKDRLCRPRCRRVGHHRPCSRGPGSRPRQRLLRCHPRCWSRRRGRRPLLLCLLLAVASMSERERERERERKKAALYGERMTGLFSLFVIYFNVASSFDYHRCHLSELI
ncbi:unnamed protein product, partial [Musa banksii]